MNHFYVAVDREPLKLVSPAKNPLYRSRFEDLGKPGRWERGGVGGDGGGCVPLLCLSRKI